MLGRDDRPANSNPARAFQPSNRNSDAAATSATAIEAATPAPRNSEDRVVMTESVCCCDPKPTSGFRRHAKRLTIAAANKTMRHKACDNGRLDAREDKASTVVAATATWRAHASVIAGMSSGYADSNPVPPLKII